MKGWSMTRDFYFAGSWAGVVLEIDKDKLKDRFEIKPIAWNYTMAGKMPNYHKKEREEFVIARRIGKTFDEIIEEYQEKMEKAYEEYSRTGKSEAIDSFPFDDWIDYLKAPESKTIPMSFVKGIWLSDKMVEIYGEGNERRLT